MIDLWALFQKAFFFTTLISIVVIVHELGHFFVARLCRVRVEAFSLFFGKPIIKWKRAGGDTEWRIGAFPLGGYVKMVGQSDLGMEKNEEEDEEIRKVSFAHKSLPARMAIVAAGPAMNVVLAFFIFTMLFFYGYPTTTTLIGEVREGGAAYQAGLRPGDRVVAVDGRALWRWDDLAEVVEENPGRPLAFKIERGQESLSLTVTPKMGRKKNIFQFEVDAGLIGVSPDGFLPIMGITGPDTPAARAGLLTGDIVQAVNDQPVRYFADLERIVADLRGTIAVTVVRGGLSTRKEDREPAHITLSLEVSSDSPSLKGLGIERADLHILEVVEDGAAARGGLMAGDRLLRVGDRDLVDWPDFTAVVRGNPEKELTITVLRQGEPLTLTMTPEPKEETNILGEFERFGRVGVYPWIAYSAPEIRSEKYWNPFVALRRGAEMTAHWTVLTFKGFAYLFTGEVSVKTLGGPIMIADLAGKSAKGGFFSFVMFIAIISLNLAIINILPIPILDGGHLVLFAVEGVLRRPLPEAAMRFVMNIGLFIIGLLIIATFFNDVARIFPSLRTLFGFLN